MYLCATEGTIQQLMHTSYGCALRLKPSIALGAQHRYTAGLRVHVSGKGAAADGQQPPAPLRVQAVPVLLLQLLRRQCRVHASQLAELCHQTGPHTLRAKGCWVSGVMSSKIQYVCCIKGCLPNKWIWQPRHTVQHWCVASTPRCLDSQLAELCHQIGAHILRAKCCWVTGKTVLLCITHQPGAVRPKYHLRAANFFEAGGGIGRIRAFHVGHIPLRGCAKEQQPHLQTLSHVQR